MYPLQPAGASAVGYAWIATSVLDALSSEATVAAPLETGGVLLGYWSESPVAPVITHRIGPGPSAVHETHRFVPDHRFQELEVARLYRESSGQLQYLGDWHTHPNNAGYLSRKDRRTLRRIARSPEARATRPLMLILAYGPEWHPVVWSIRERQVCQVWTSFRTEQWAVRAF